MSTPIFEDGDTLEYYQDNEGEYRWRVINSNGELVFAAWKGFSSREAAENNFCMERRRSGYREYAATSNVIPFITPKGRDLGTFHTKEDRDYQNDFIETIDQLAFKVLADHCDASTPFRMEGRTAELVRFIRGLE